MNGHLKDLECGGRPMTKNELKIKNLEQENQQLKSKLEASEKARKDGIDYIRTELLCFDNESIEHIEGLKILNILDIEEGE